MDGGTSEIVLAHWIDVLAMPSEELVSCALCGVRKKNLVTHVIKSHGMLTEDYRDEYPDSPLVVPSIAAKLLACTKRFNESEEGRATHVRTMTAYNKSELGRLNVAIAQSCRKHAAPSANTLAALVAYTKSDRGRETASRTLRTTVHKLWTSDRDGSVKRALENMRSAREEYNGTVYRSGLEILFARTLDSLALAFEYEPLSFDYSYEGCVHSYTPDFFVLDWNSFVEVKPEVKHDSPRVCAKLACVRSAGWDIILAGSSFIEDLRGNCVD